MIPILHPLTLLLLLLFDDREVEKKCSAGGSNRKGAGQGGTDLREIAQAWKMTWKMRFEGRWMRRVERVFKGARHGDGYYSGP